MEEKILKNKHKMSVADMLNNTGIIQSVNF